MERDAARRLHGEAGNWLSRGRGHVIEALLRRHRPPGDGVLEIGAGVGSYVPLLAPSGPVDVVETNPEARRLLERRGDVRTVFSAGIPALLLDRRYGMIAAFDVIEHIADDRVALAWIAAHLVNGGLFVATVPAYPWMFSDHDRANHHYRRYTVRALADVMPEELTVVETGFFNTLLFPAAAAARLAWMAKRRFGRKVDGAKQPSSVPKFLDELLVRFLRAEAMAIHAGARLPFGLSLYCIARRT